MFVDILTTSIYVKVRDYTLDRDGTPFYNISEGDTYRKLKNDSGQKDFFFFFFVSLL